MSEPIRKFRVVGFTRISEDWSEDSKAFLVQAHCEVSREEMPGGEAFSVTVTNALQLQQELRGDGVVEFGRGYIFMEDYNERALLVALETLIDGSGASDWTELHHYVDRYFDWV